MKLRSFLKRIEARVAFRATTWEQVLARNPVCLYAGDLPGKRGYEKFVGLSLTQRNRWHLRHDVTERHPIPDNSVDLYVSEDVFEHIAFEQVPAILSDVYRILKPGGMFRLAVPDYRCDVLVNRSVKDSSGNIIFDPQGGGRFAEGRVVDSGHVWFPVYETIRALLTQTPFRTLDFRHYYTEEGEPVTKPIDYSKSHVQRTPDHDPRVRDPFRPMSIVVDCYK